MTASNMATIKQEFDSSGIPSMKPYLDYLLEKRAAKHVTIRWGQSYRKVIFIGGKRYQYKGGHDINKNLKNKIVPLYISMSKSSKQNVIINDIVAPNDDADDNKYGTKTPLCKPARRLRRKTQTNVIQQWVKQNKDNFKQEDHKVQLVLEVTTLEGE